MSDVSILGIARTGMQTGLDGMKKNAISIASKDAMQTQNSPVNDIVDMKVNKYQVLASGKVVETVDEMLGSLLDVKA
ncbi:MAG: flagellar biosynthesis protein FlgE [Gammaproteobacteria bacterium]|nr:flagellar biosynthesis protein FlgE [Gammaproteobacteria bacterium]